jgi:NADH:ubiquinone oxidoreductase subunit 6 (subunit J)
MIAFGIGFMFWLFALFAVRNDNTTHESSWAALLGTTCCIAYIFWGIGWALAWVADVIKLAVI